MQTGWKTTCLFGWMAAACFLSASPAWALVLTNSLDVGVTGSISGTNSAGVVETIQTNAADGRTF